jgi:hypothetical protein
VSIAQQIATPTPADRTRAPGAPLRPVPTARPGWALVRIAGLVAVTALGVCLVSGAIALAIMVLASSLGG